MDKNESSVINYPDEPGNYTKIREDVLLLMNDIRGIRERFKDIKNLGLIIESFQKECDEMSRNLTNDIFILGGIYGHLLSDDVEQNKI